MSDIQSALRERARELLEDGKVEYEIGRASCRERV